MNPAPTLVEVDQYSPYAVDSHGVVLDRDGNPLTAYRGQYGANSQIETKLPSIAFAETMDSAEQYSKEPNKRGDEVVQARVYKANLTILNPLVNDPSDPFIDLSIISEKLGQDMAIAMAKEYAPLVEQTSAWGDVLESEPEADVSSLLDRNPESVNKLYVEAYLMLDNQCFIDRMKDKGYDGAIHCGNGETALETEFRILELNQAQVVTEHDPSSFL